MHSPAAALAWEFWGRHRWGLAGAAAVVAGFAAYCAAVPVSGQFASVSSIWFMMALCYVIGVFAYGFEARLETAESGFPGRLFVLPVRTWVLVGWPMVQGIAVAVLMWVAWNLLVLRPAGIEAPAWWTAMLAAVVAVSQALVWTPFGLPWARLVVASVVLISLVRAPAVLALAADRPFDSDAESRVLSLIAVALIPVAFVFARAGVARARRGDGIGWSGAVRSPRPSGGPGRERSPFASAMRAQTWYEWRLRGRVFVMTVAAVVAMVMAVGLLIEHRATRPDLVMVFLLIPLLIAAYFGCAFGSPGDSFRSTALSAFAATRPLGSVALVAAKVRAATIAAAVVWAVLVVVSAVWLAGTAGDGGLPRTWRVLVERQGHDRAVGYLALTAVVLVLGTWRALVANLYIGLCGRAWLVPAQTVVMTLLVFQVLAEYVLWNADVGRRERMLEWLPDAIVAAVVLKFLLAGWALRALVRRGHVSAGAAVRFAGVWLVATATLFAGLAWFVPPSLVPAHWLAVGVLLFVPLARLAAAPLAVAWNRHR